MLMKFGFFKSKYQIFLIHKLIISIWTHEFILILFHFLDHYHLVSFFSLQSILHFHEIQESNLQLFELAKGNFDYFKVSLLPLLLKLPLLNPDYIDLSFFFGSLLRLLLLSLLLSPSLSLLSTIPPPITKSISSFK